MLQQSVSQKSLDFAFLYRWEHLLVLWATMRALQTPKTSAQSCFQTSSSFQRHTGSLKLNYFYRKRLISFDCW